MAHLVTVTDTFGGEANFSWKREYLIDSPTAPYRSAAYRWRLIRAAKAAAGWTGDKCRTDDNAGSFRLYPRKARLVMFIDESKYATESELRAMCDKWARHIGLGFHPDTAAGDYEPALASGSRQAYRADMATLFRSAEYLGVDAYGIALESFERLKMIDLLTQDTRVPYLASRDA